MFDNMRRLHPRGAANRGICGDADGAMLGPDCVLVHRTPCGFRGIEREDASMLQKCALDMDRDEDWLFSQCQRIVDALNKGEVALAQIYGLRIPIGDLNERQLERVARARLSKAGFNADEPRIPKGQPHGGEWTTDGDGDGAAFGPPGVDAINPDYTIENLLFGVMEGGGFALSTSSRALARALAAIGVARPMGFETHHIVAALAKPAAPARAIMERLGIGINDPAKWSFSVGGSAFRTPHSRILRCH